MKLEPIIKLSVAALALAMTALLAPATHAIELEPQYFVAGNQIGSWMKPIVKAPKGWIENEEWTQRHERLVLFENGDMSRSKPMMYVRAHMAEEQPLEAYIKGAQDNWRGKVNDTVIEPLPDFERPGKPPIKLFLYRNPSHPEQAFELTAFVKDHDAKQPHSIVFLQVVVLAGSKEMLEQGRPAFMELLGNL